MKKSSLNNVNYLFLDHSVEMEGEKANAFPSNTLWSQPYQITMPTFERGEYLVLQDSTGKFHCVFIKRLSLYGFSVHYFRTINNKTTRWTIPEQILMLDATIEEFQLAKDQNDTLYVAFIAQREGISEIGFLTKERGNKTWSEFSILSRNLRRKYSSLTIETTPKGFLEIAWISKNNQEEMNTRESYVDFVQIALENKSICNREQIFRELSPEKVRLKLLLSGTVITIVSLWNQQLETSEILWSRFFEENFTWSEPLLLDTYPLSIAEIEIYASRIIDGFHLLWTAEDVSRKLLHLEVFSNGSLRTAHNLINNPNYSAFIVGLTEDPLTANLLVFFEEVVGSQMKINYKMRLGETLSWQISQALTTNGKGTKGQFIPYVLSPPEPLGEIFYCDFNRFVAVTFNSTTNFSPEKEILLTMVDNNQASMIIDNDGNLHLVWEHNGLFNSEIYYQKRLLNGSWSFAKSITMEEGIISAKDPQLLLDTNNTLYCFFIADDLKTGYNSLFYCWKNIWEENWSKTNLVKAPENYAEEDNYAVLLDKNNTIHLVWAEQKSIYQNRLYYSRKEADQQNFSSIVLLENGPQISAVTPNLAIDSKGNLHLTYSLIDRNVPANFIKYRIKPPGEEWLWEETLDVIANGLLEQPLQVVDSQDTLQVMYLKKFYDGPYFVSDSIFLSKKLGGTWKKAGAIFEHEMTNFHNLLQLDNDTLLYLQQITNLPIDNYPEGNIDFVMVSTRIKGESWSSKELLFNNPMFNSEPRGIFDARTKELFVSVLERRGAKTQLHLLSRQNDTDNDLLGDLDEIFFKTNPSNKDSDKDNLIDGMEVINYGTSPTLKDTDWDNLTDGLEVSTYHSNPLTIDSDQDGLYDGEEVSQWFTDPTNPDSDYDKLSDFEELFLYGTNPNKNDTENDGMPDAWEINYELNPLQNDSNDDPDNDQLTNLEEFWSKTNPHINDSDTDELTDGEEVKIWLTDPLNIDTDADTISDADEVLRFGTNPLTADSDGDGFTDREEINAGTDPLKKNDNPFSRKVKRILLNTLLPILAFGMIILSLEIRYQKKTKQLMEQEKSQLLKEEQRLLALRRKTEQ